MLPSWIIRSAASFFNPEPSEQRWRRLTSVTAATEGGRGGGREREGGRKGRGAGTVGFKGVRRSLQQKHTFVFYLLCYCLHCMYHLRWQCQFIYCANKVL